MEPLVIIPYWRRTPKNSRTVVWLAASTPRQRANQKHDKRAGFLRVSRRDKLYCLLSIGKESRWSKNSKDTHNTQHSSTVEREIRNRLDKNGYCMKTGGFVPTPSVTSNVPLVSRIALKSQPFIIFPMMGGVHCWELAWKSGWEVQNLIWCLSKCWGGFSFSFGCVTLILIKKNQRNGGKLNYIPPTPITF